MKILNKQHKKHKHTHKTNATNQFNENNKLHRKQKVPHKSLTKTNSNKLCTVELIQRSRVIITLKFIGDNSLKQAVQEQTPVFSSQGKFSTSMTKDNDLHPIITNSYDVKYQPHYQNIFPRYQDLPKQAPNIHRTPWCLDSHTYRNNQSTPHRKSIQTPWLDDEIWPFKNLDCCNPGLRLVRNFCFST